MNSSQPQGVVDVFVEAHYYSGGICYQHFPRSMPRPAWAPRSDQVGFRNEFPVVGNACAVEWCRLLTASGDKVTWLALYRPAVDAVLGSRENHAGIGVWLRGPVEFSATEVLKSLNVALKATKLVDGKLSPADDNLFSEFLDWLNNAIFPGADFWGGLNHGSGALRQGKLWQIMPSDQFFGNIGRHIGALSHSLTVLNEDRYLYAVTSDTQADLEAVPSVEMIDTALFQDVSSNVAKMRHEHDKNVDRCAQLEASKTEHEGQIAIAQKKIASLENDAAALLTTLAAVKQGPKEIMFQTRDQILFQLADLVRRVDELGDQAAANEIFAKLDRIQSAIGRLEKYQSLPSTPPVFQGNSPVPTHGPAQRLPALPPEQGNRRSNAYKAIVAVFVIVVTAIVAALAWKFWLNSL